MAAMPAKAETINITQSTTYTLENNTSYENALFSGSAEAETESFSVTFDGQEQYGLSFAVTEKPQRKSSIFDLSSSRGKDISLNFSNLAELNFSAEAADFSSTWRTLAKVNTSGKAALSITNVSGSVSIQGFTGKTLSDSTISVFSTSDNDADIKITNISGKFLVSNNTAENRTDMFYSIGLCARTNPKSQQIGNARILLSNIDEGIEISNNAQSGSPAVSGLIFSCNTGLGESSINISHIREGITIANNDINAYGIMTAIAGSSQWNPPDRELVTGNASISLTNVQGNVKFSDNRAYGSGAICVIGRECHVEISGIEGNVQFLNNSGTASGAIYCAPDPDDKDPQRSMIILSADGGNIIFNGNTVGKGDVIVSNAMVIGKESDVFLNAATGNTVSFYDPVVIDDSGHTSTVNLNTGSYTGEILFSGLNADAGNAANYTSVLDADVIQYNGTVHLNHKAAMEAVTYTQQGGSLVMGNGASLNTTGNITLDNLLIQINPGAEANSISCGGSFILSGNLSIEGFAGSLSPNTEILSITSKEQPISPEHTSFSSEGIVYAMNTSWNYNEEEDAWNLLLTSGDIQATGVINSLSGAGVVNSMLSTASNIQSFSDAAMEHLSQERFLSNKKSSLWLSSMGGFSMQRTQGGTDGFDYQGGGYSLGGDFRLSRKWILGAAYGQMFGRNISRELSSTNRQDSIMGLVNTAWHHAFNNRHSVTVGGAIAYGSTSNKLKTSIRDGGNLDGDWNNQAFSGVLKAAWNITLRNNFVLSPNLGMEYTDVRQNAFSETGYLARRFDRGHYRNLALPLGVSLQKSFALANGRSWDNTVSIHYIPDIYRDQPEGRASLPNYSWDVRGSHASRNAVRAGVFSRLELNSSWSTYCSYRLEARSNTVQQTCSAGFSHTF